MTGNNKFWRASLAGLASVAMLATMGVAASTANAAAAGSGFDDAGTFQVLVYDKTKPDESPYTVTAKGYGEVVDLATEANPYAFSADKVLDYYSTDLAGKDKVSTDFPIIGDVKLYAQYKDAVTVSFDVNNDGKIVAADGDKTIKIAKGDSIPADKYAATVTEPAFSGSSLTDPTFVGWSTTYSKSESSNNLYEDTPITADTTLYPVKASAQNVSTIAFRNFGEVESSYKWANTLNGHPFPAYRLAEYFSAGAGTWDYDFKAPIAANKNIGTKYNTADNLDKLATFTPADASARNVTVHFDVTTNAPAPKTYNFNTQATPVTTTSDQKIAEPTAPAYAGAVFTGWYLPRVDGKSVKYDFSKSVAENFPDASGNVTVYAGWDITNVSRLVFNLQYKRYPVAQIVEYVYPGTEVTLPAGLEDYYQTDADNDTDSVEHKYSARKLAGWTYGAAEDVVSKAVSPAKGATTEFKAAWSEDASYLLDANGGKFADGSASQWVTIADGSALSFPTPTREGFTFAAWQYAPDGADLHKQGKVLNTANGKYYNYDASKQGFFDITSKPATYPTTHKDLTIAAGDQLKALWVANATDVTEATYNFNGVLKYESLEQDYASVEQAGYTKDSAKKFVDAQYALRGEYAAYKALADGSQAKIDAAAKLAPKYADAQKLLVKSDVTVKPTPAQKVPVYRLYNPGMPQAAQHFYTASKTEYDNLVTTAGWQGEGIAWYTTDQKTDKPVYRLYSRFNSAHFYTTSKAEYDKSVANGWTGEDVAWYVADDADTDVYRLYNDLSGEHLYTTNAAEKDDLVANAGWTFEQVEYKVYAK